jgi:hypothetical protein
MAKQPSNEKRASLIYGPADRLRAAGVAELHEYWRSKLRGRAMPVPADIDPTEIPHLLPAILIAEYIGGRVRYRLVGTAQAYYNGLDFTGLHLDEIDFGIENAFVRLVHDTLRRTAAPVFGQYEWAFRDDLNGFGEFGVFPLSEDGRAVSRCIGIDDYLPFERTLAKKR